MLFPCISPEIPKSQIFTVKRIGKGEVTHLNEARFIAAHEDVLELQVPVDHFVLVAVDHRGDELTEVLLCLVLREALLLLEALKQSPSRDVLHDEDDVTLLQREAVLYLDDVFVDE